MTNLSKMLTVVAVLCLFIACAKKAQETARYNPPSQENRQQKRGQRGGPPQFSELLARMDSNKDGKLSASEVQGRLKNDFVTIDADADGYITETEMKNAPRPERRGRN